MSLTTKNYIITVFFFSILIQYIQINIGFSSVRLYMILTIIYSVIFLKYIKISKLFLYEFFLIFLYLYITISGLYAMDYILALQIIIGQLIILLSYFLGRYLVGLLSLYEFENLFIRIGKYFVGISFFIYLAGIFVIYSGGFQASSFTSLGEAETSFRVYGVFFEGEFLPRLAGLAESPNNFVYYGSIFFFSFLYKKEKLFSYITFIMLFLTFSSTFYVIAFISLFFYSIYKHKMLGFIFGVSIVVGIVLFLYNEYPDIKDFIDFRMERNKTGSGRFELWEYVLNKIAEEPILGYGANQSRIIIAPLRHLMSTHNTFLEVFISSGIGGAMIFIFFISSMLHISLKLVKKMRDPLFLVLFINYIFFISANNSLHIDAFYYILIYAYASKMFRSKHV